MEFDPKRREFMYMTALAAAGFVLNACSSPDNRSQELQIDQNTLLTELPSQDISTLPRQEVFNQSQVLDFPIGVDSGTFIEALSAFRYMVDPISLEAVKPSADKIVAGFFHWTNHFPEWNMCPSDLKSCADLTWTVAKAGIDGKSQIFHRAASDMYDEAYLIYSKVNGQVYNLILSAKNASPITVIRIGINSNGNPTESRVTGDIAKHIRNQGLVQVQELPENIKTTWQNRPRIGEFTKWILQHRLAVQSATIMTQVKDYIVSNPQILNPTIVFVPGLMLDPNFQDCMLKYDGQTCLEKLNSETGEATYIIQ